MSSEHLSGDSELMSIKVKRSDAANFIGPMFVYLTDRTASFGTASWSRTKKLGRST